MYRVKEITQRPGPVPGNKKGKNMTREQYYEMAENFCKYCNKDVEYKSMNLHPQTNNTKKYNTGVATLIGVGIWGNAEHFILSRCGQRMAIHYSKIVFPKN